MVQTQDIIYHIQSMQSFLMGGGRKQTRNPAFTSCNTVFIYPIIDRIFPHPRWCKFSWINSILPNISFHHLNILLMEDILSVVKSNLHSRWKDIDGKFIENCLGFHQTLNHQYPSILPTYHFTV